MMFSEKNHTFAVCAYKESAYLEECIQSLCNQTVKSNIIIATSTPNDLISSMAEKYGLKIFINEGEKGIGGDWNFAYNSADTELVTIAHQDDVYEPDYLKEMLESLNKADSPIIAFSGYGELRDGKKVYDNKLLKTKKLLLSPLKSMQKSRFMRRRSLSLGNPICCPAVTYVKSVCGASPFTNNFKSNIDWELWEVLSKLKGTFAFNPKPLTLHRIHEESTTSELINDNSRTEEDLAMFKKFWPGFMARFIMKFYSGSQDSNKQ